ncbi:MAG: DUF2281 domain-containing protein [Chitinophagales bacterium]
MSSISVITTKLEQLPPKALKQANDYIEFLHQRYSRQRPSKKTINKRVSDNPQFGK